ncbi:MAG: putative lipoprotein [Labilithrix sp.]|nr:putative lipoprotein [Labilithrix sp.]
MSDEKTSEDEKKDALTAALSEGTPEETRAETSEEPVGLAPGEGDADDEEALDSASPEAIARRVAALGDEDQEEARSREEERKLAERRAGTKKKTAKKGGLEVAASKKLSKIGTRAEPRRTTAVAQDADPLIERTAQVGEWAKRNQKTVQIVGALIAVALLGVAGFLYRENKQETEASALLTKAVEDERARVGEPPKEEDPESTAEAPLSFKTFEARRESALGKYREIESKFPKTGAAILARLAEGSLLLDKREPDAALAAFNDVKGSALAAADKEVRGRAMEGTGFAYELKAATSPDAAAKNLDDALKAYKELENLDVRGFREMAIYHEARVTELKGEKDKAKELLVGLKDRLAKNEDGTMASMSQNQPPEFPYLKEVALDRLRAIDPAAAPKVAPPARNPGGSQLTQEQIRKMIEDAQRKQKSAPAGSGH